MTNSRKSGFTLVELLVVIAIIGVSGRRCSCPPCRRRAKSSRRTKCLNNLKQLGLAMHNYHDTIRSFPPGRGSGPWGPNPGTNWESWWILSVSYQALAYYEQGTVYELFEQRKNQTKGRHVGQRRRPRENAAAGLYLPVVSVVTKRLSGDELPLVHGQ